MEKQKQKGFKQINSKTAHSFKFFSDRKKADSIFHKDEVHPFKTSEKNFIPI